MSSRAENVPPVAPTRPHTHREHGVVRDDPWYWLRERTDPAVRTHLEAENTYLQARLGHLDGLRKQLYTEYLSRLQEDHATLPAPDGPFAYYRRTERGKAYPIYCRRPEPSGPEQVLLDVNALAVGHDYTSVRGVHYSPDHALLAYAIDNTGQEQYVLRFRDLATGQDLPETVANTSGDVAFAGARSVWTTLLDAAQRSYQVVAVQAGSTAAPELVYEEGDEEFRVGVARSRSGKYLFLECHNAGSTEISYTKTNEPLGPLTCVFPRRPKAKYDVTHAGNSLYVITNVGADDVPASAVNGRLLELPLAGGAPIERLAHRPDTELVAVSGFSDKVVVVERPRGQKCIRVFDLAFREDLAVPVPEVPSVVDMDENPSYETPLVRYNYGSLTTPHTVFCYDVAKREVVTSFPHPVPNYDPSRYTTERLEVDVGGGIKVPVSVVRRADVTLDEPRPLVLYGYGAYGITIDPLFSLTRVSMLDRGAVFAIAHVRGGGFYGQDWYEAGKLVHKHRSFDDFIAVGRHLVALGYTRPDRLTAWGGSAGGLLVGAVMNRAPELFKAVVANVPFVDVVTTMLDVSLPLTAGEWQEWGDPREREAFDRMRSYSPTDNVTAMVYPNLLATAGFSDPRVSYWEPAKWVARLRATATGGEFLLKTELSSGHQGKSGRYGRLEEVAFEASFLLDQLGLAEVTPL